MHYIKQDLYRDQLYLHQITASGGHSGKIFCIRYQQIVDIAKTNIELSYNFDPFFRFSVQYGAFCMVLLPSFQHVIGTGSGIFLPTSICSATV